MVVSGMSISFLFCLALTNYWLCVPLNLWALSIFRFKSGKQEKLFHIIERAAVCAKFSYNQFPAIIPHKHEFVDGLCVEQLF
jgi:hypothetical protein